MNFWAGKKILVTGGTGFIGSHVVDQLRSENCSQIYALSSKDCNLVKEEEVKGLFKNLKPDIVFHLAGRTGGIMANIREPAQMFFENILMNTYVIEYAFRSEVKKLVHLVAGCSYPKDAPIPTKEEDYWDGYPESTSAAYSLAKKMYFVQSKAYREQYGFDSIALIPENVYGPRDRGFYDIENSHVVAAMVHKFINAKENNEDRVVLWGDGSPTRSFQYVEDVAYALLVASEKYNSSEPLNIGVSKETSISELAYTIKDIVKYDGEIVWDETKPKGQPRRCFDVSKSNRILGTLPVTPLRDGLKKTVKWYAERGDKTQDTYITSA